MHCAYLFNLIIATKQQCKMYMGIRYTIFDIESALQ